MKTLPKHTQDYYINLIRSLPYGSCFLKIVNNTNNSYKIVGFQQLSKFDVDILVEVFNKNKCSYEFIWFTWHWTINRYSIEWKNLNTNSIIYNMELKSTIFNSIETTFEFFNKLIYHKSLVESFVED